jgi:hypothetical protein
MGSGADPYRQPPQPQPQPRPQAFAPQDEGRPGGEYGLPPLPRFDARGRQVSAPHEAADLDQAAGGLAHQLSGAGGRNRSMGELLTRGADQPDPAYGGQGYGSAPAPAYGGGRAAPAGAGQLRIEELARAIDHRTAADVWHRMRAGEHGVLGRHIYTYDGQVTFEEISGRYDRDGEFRNTVDRYIGDFERLLAEAEQSDPTGHMLQNYLTSETGRVYLLLSHASGRLR